MGIRKQGFWFGSGKNKTKSWKNEIQEPEYLAKHVLDMCGTDFPGKCDK